MASHNKRAKLIEAMSDKKFHEIIDTCVNQDTQLSRLHESNRNLLEIFKCVNPELIKTLSPQLEVYENIVAHRQTQTDPASYCSTCIGTENDKDIFVDEDLIYTYNIKCDMHYTPMITLGREVMSLVKENTKISIYPSAWFVSFIKMMTKFPNGKLDERNKYIKHMFLKAQHKKKPSLDYLLWGVHNNDEMDFPEEFSPKCGILLNYIMDTLTKIDFPLSRVIGIPDMELLIHYVVLSLSVANSSCYSYEKFCRNESSLKKETVAVHLMEVVDHFRKLVSDNRQWDKVKIKMSDGRSIIIGPHSLISDLYNVCMDHLKKSSSKNLNKMSPLFNAIWNEKRSQQRELRDDEEYKYDFALFYTLVRTSLILYVIKSFCRRSYVKDEDFYKMVLSKCTNLFSDENEDIIFYHSTGSLFSGFYMILNLLPKNTDRLALFRTSDDPLKSIYSTREHTSLISARKEEGSLYMTELEHREYFCKIVIHICMLFYKFNGQIPSYQVSSELNNLKERYNIELFKFLVENSERTWFCTDILSPLLMYMKDLNNRNQNYTKLSSKVKQTYNAQNDECIANDNFAFFNNPVLFSTN